MALNGFSLAGLAPDKARHITRVWIYLRSGLRVGRISQACLELDVRACSLSRAVINATVNLDVVIRKYHSSTDARSHFVERTSAGFWARSGVPVRRLRD